MKRILTLFLVGILLLPSLFACGAEAPQATTAPHHVETESVTAPKEALFPKTLSFSTQSVITGPLVELENAPAVLLFRSASELSEYYAEKEALGLNRGYGGCISFAEAITRYDEAYFHDHILIMVLYYAPHCDTHYETESVKQQADGTLLIKNRVVQEGTDDGVQYTAVFIEPESGVTVANEQAIILCK